MSSIFDPTNAVTFDLALGLVHLDDAPSRLLVPAAALVEVARAAGADASMRLASAMGEPLGTRVARRLSTGEGESPGGAGVAKATVEAVVDHLGGELALAGLGALSLERWGRALLLVVDHCPLEAVGDELLAAVLSSALRRATGREVACLPVMRDGARVRVLVTGPEPAARARAWLLEGVSWGDALARLHTQVESPRGAS